MAIDMSGTIDGTFTSLTVTLLSTLDGDYDSDGIWQDGTESQTTFQANVQPVSDKELESLELGSERINDVRRVYPASSVTFKLSPYMKLQFDEGSGVKTYRIVKSDVRPWNNYAKIICEVIDD